MSSSPTFVPNDFPGEITLDHVIPGAAARFAPLPADVRPELAAALAARGIVRLYTHQADAYHAVRNGRHLVVVTPTASGKTLCYNLPVLQRLLEHPELVRAEIDAEARKLPGPVFLKPPNLKTFPAKVFPRLK